ncbi:MAG: hypothetical protein WCY11_01355 [Novosphingobium sp.]
MTPRTILLLGLPVALLTLQGCVAKAAYNVATAPVRAAGKTVDVLTTSQSEADEKRGRALRHREERLGKLERRYEKETAACQRGDAQACESRYATWNEMDALRPSIPVEPGERR